MEPICELTRALIKNEKEIYEPKLEKLKLVFTQEDRKETGKDFLKTVMSKWLPAADCLL
jgi:elongation factor 2